MEIKVETAAKLKDKPQDESKLGFGKIFTDHMFSLKYESGKGWFDPKISPYASIEMDPATNVLHYGQTIFEGLKAYKTRDGRTLLFRPRDNFLRMNRSAERMCIPQLDIEDAMQGLLELVRKESAWIPTQPGTSLYIRPFTFATEPFLGVHVSKSYLFMIILSPVGAYYPDGLKPVKIFVEDEYVRAVVGGTGYAKTAANYASSLKGGEKAEAIGYTQVLWLDGKEHKYIEEVGAMNMFFVIGDEIVTPELSGSILAGITRDSVLAYARHMGIKVTERRIAIDEIVEAHANGVLKEAFGTGTAAVISPVGMLKVGEKELLINNGEMGPISKLMYDSITGIQYGELEDPFGWTMEI